MLAGAGVLRADAAGYELEHLEDRHYRALHRALEQALADGALGVSLGLGYAPECFYTTAELIRAPVSYTHLDVYKRQPYRHDPRRGAHRLRGGTGRAG